MDIQKVTLRSPCWFCNMDDTYVIWPHGPDRFLVHLNGTHGNILFTKEIQKEIHLLFWTITSTGDHNIYQKPTHTHLYRNPESHHHPSNTQAIFSTLMQGATALCNADRVHEDLRFINATFKQEGTARSRYNTLSIHLWEMLGPKRSLTHSPATDLDDLAKLTVAEHLQDIKIICTKSSYMD